MKIAYISGSAIPSVTANSIHVMKMCQAMVEEGHSVNLMVSDQNEFLEKDTRDIFYYYGLNVSFIITRYANSKYWHTWDFSLSAVNAAKKESVELIYTRHLPAAFISTLKGIPTIYEIHDVPRGRIGANLFPLLLRSGQLSRLVVLTDALKRRVTDIWPAAMKKVTATVAHDAVDIERFQNLPLPQQAREHLGLEERFTVGYVGSFYSGRGLEAILSMAEQCPEAFFHLVGGSIDAIHKFNQEARTLNLRNIGFWGHVPNVQVPMHLAACDVLLMPHQRIVTVSGGGGNIADVCSPLKMFEYLAAGRMVISSDLPVFREIVNDASMILLPPEDINAWVAAIKRAIHDVTWRRNYADAGRALVQMHTWRARVRKCLDEYPDIDLENTE